MIYILAGRVLQFLVGVAMVKTMTTLLPPTEVGKYSLASAAIAFFAIIQSAC